MTLFYDIGPRLKKPSLDPDILNNSRPVSHLPLVSKIMEKVVDTRGEQHLLESNLYGPLQSAGNNAQPKQFKPKYKTIPLQTLDSGRVAALVLLNLSAAFDTIDHDILVERLKQTRGSSGDVLAWMASYLLQRCQQIIIGDNASAVVALEYGVTP